MPDETMLVVRGRFTEDELAEIIAVVRRAEAKRPQELFSVVVNEPDEAAEELVAKLRRANPLPPGYVRTEAFLPFDQP